MDRRADVEIPQVAGGLDRRSFMACLSSLGLATGLFPGERYPFEMTANWIHFSGSQPRSRA